jgi:hypothetical protein
MVYDEFSGVHSLLGSNLYWTAGSDEECNGKFIWCNTRELFQNWDSWPKSEPSGDPNRNCVILSYVLSPTNTHDFNMHDIPCNDTNNFFICEVRYIVKIKLLKVQIFIILRVLKN